MAKMRLMVTIYKSLKRRLVQYFLLYPKIVRKASKGLLCLVGFEALGDNLIILSRIDDYLMHRRKRVAVFGDERLLKLAPFYPQIDFFVLLTHAEAKVVAAKPFSILPKMQKKKIVVVASHWLGHEIGVSAVDRMSNVLNLPRVGKITFPSVPYLEVSIPKDSVLVLPKSASYFSSAVFLRIKNEVFNLLSSGYSVYVNCGEKCFGTHPGLHYEMWDLTTLYNSCRYMKCIYAIRTGLLDFLAGTKVPMKVFTEENDRGTYLRAYFGMEMWGNVAVENVNVIQSSNNSPDW